MGRVLPSHWLPPGVTHRPGEGALWCQASPLSGLQWARRGVEQAAATPRPGPPPLLRLRTETGRQGQAQKGGSWREDIGRGKAEGRKREVGSGQHPPTPEELRAVCSSSTLGTPGLGAGQDDSQWLAPTRTLSAGPQRDQTVPRRPHTAPLFRGPVRKKVWQRPRLAGKEAQSPVSPTPTRAI